MICITDKKPKEKVNVNTVVYTVTFTVIFLDLKLDLRASKFWGLEIRRALKTYCLHFWYRSTSINSPVTLCYYRLGGLQ